MTREFLDMIIRLEGSFPKLYKDPIGLYTIGVGHLVIKNDHRLKKVLGTDKISELKKITMTEDQIAELLELDLSVFRRSVEKKVESFKERVSENQIDAMTSLAFNVGRGGFGRSTLLKKLKADAAPLSIAKEFLRWNRAGGRVFAGLVNRRCVEAHVFLGSREIIPELMKGVKPRHVGEVKALLKIYWRK